MGNFISWNPIK